MKKYIKAAIGVLSLSLISLISVQAGTKCDTPIPREDGFVKVQVPYDETYMNMMKNISGSSTYPKNKAELDSLYIFRRTNDMNNWSSSKTLFEERGYIPTPYPGEPSPYAPSEPTPNPDPTPTPSDPVNPDPSSQRANIEAFVSRFYQTILSRTPDTGGLKYWADGLEKGEYSGASLAQGFIMSEEFEQKNTNNQEYLNALYRAFFNREADPSGNTYWMGQLNSGCNRADVLQGFVNSNEFTSLCESYGMPRGTMNKGGSVIYNAGARNFVMRCYEKTLGRKGETNGVEYWSDVINTKSMSPLGVASNGFFHSQEFLNKNTTNEQFVEICYLTFLDRTSDNGGKNYWLNEMQSGKTRDQVLAGFAYSQEFSAIMRSYGLSAESVSEEFIETEANDIDDRNDEAKQIVSMAVPNEIYASVGGENTVSENQMEETEVNEDDTEVSELSLEEDELEVEGTIQYVPVTAKFEQSLAYYEVLTELNNWRKKNGVAPLKWDYALEDSAKLRSVESQICCMHMGFVDPWDDDSADSLCNFESGGEIQLSNGTWYGLTNEQLAHEIIAQFANSPAHNKIMLGNYSRVGIGISRNVDGGNAYGYYVIIRFCGEH